MDATWQDFFWGSSADQLVAGCPPNLEFWLDYLDTETSLSVESAVSADAEIRVGMSGRSQKWETARKPTPALPDTHTHSHLRTHTFTHSHTHIYSHIHTHTLTQHIYTYTHTHIHTYTNSHTYTDTHTHTHPLVPDEEREISGEKRPYLGILCEQRRNRCFAQISLHSSLSFLWGGFLTFPSDAGARSFRPSEGCTLCLASGQQNAEGGTERLLRRGQRRGAAAPAQLCVGLPVAGAPAAPCEDPQAVREAACGERSAGLRQQPAGSRLGSGPSGPSQAFGGYSRPRVGPCHSWVRSDTVWDKRLLF